MKKPCVFNKLATKIAFSKILKFDREVFHARTQFLNTCAEDVVKNRSRNSGRETHRRGHERFRDARRDSAQAGAAGIPQTFKRVDDAPDRAEQTDKRRDRGDRRQPAHVHLEFGDFLTDSKLQTALDGQFTHERAALLDLALDLAIPKVEYGDQG